MIIPTRRGCYVITRARARVFIFNCNRGLNNFCANIPTKFTDIRSFFSSRWRISDTSSFSKRVCSPLLHRDDGKQRSEQILADARAYVYMLAIRANYVTRSHVDPRRSPSIRQFPKWLNNITQSTITAIVGRGNLGNYSRLLSVPSRTRWTLMKPFIDVELHALQYASWNLEINACIAAYFNVCQERGNCVQLSE